VKSFGLCAQECSTGLSNTNALGARDLQFLGPIIWRCNYIIAAQRMKAWRKNFMPGNDRGQQVTLGSKRAFDNSELKSGLFRLAFTIHLEILNAVAQGLRWQSKAV